MAAALLPAASVTVAVKVCAPSATPVLVAQSAAVPSISQATDEPAWSSPEVTVKSAF